MSKSLWQVTHEVVASNVNYLEKSRAKNEAAKALNEAGASLLGVVIGTRRGGPIPERDETGGVHYKRTKEGQAVVTRAGSDLVIVVVPVVVVVGNRPGYFPPRGLGSRPARRSYRTCAHTC